jgi:MATE family multidrug resistance protein
MSLVDTLYIARLGTAQLAAIGIAAVLVFSVQSFCGGLIGGARILTAQWTGAGQEDETAAISWQGQWLTIPFGLAICSLTFVDSSVFSLLGANDEVANYAGEFFSIRVLGAPMLLSTMGLSAWFQGRGDTKTPMQATLLSNGLNIILDPFFIFGWAGIEPMGIGGAAVATVISFTLGWFYMIWRSAPIMRKVSMRFNPTIMRQVLHLGAPMGVHYFLSTVSYAVLTSILAFVGQVDLAAHVIVVRIVSASFLPGHAVGDATSVLVGQFVGGGHQHLAYAVYRQALKLGVGIMAFCGLVFLLVPELLVAPFKPEAEVYTVAVNILFIAALFQILDAVVMVAQGAINGAGDTRFVMYTSVAATWFIKLPIAWALAQHYGFGAVGAWLGFTGEIIILCIVYVVRIKNGRWLEHQVQHKVE